MSIQYRAMALQETGEEVCLGNHLSREEAESVVEDVPEEYQASWIEREETLGYDIPLDCDPEVYQDLMAIWHDR